MHIKNGLNVYWRETDEIQVGLDPRVGVRFADLTANELAFIDHLTLEHSEVEVKFLTKKLKLSDQRARSILNMLESAGLLSHESPTVAPSPSLTDATVEVHRADALGVSIAINLAMCGIKTIVTTDQRPVSASDHPALRRKHLGLPRDRALVGILRAINPAIGTQGEPDITVLTGSHLIDPVTANSYLAQGIPTLSVWCEEVDAYVGPLKVGRRGSCTTCLFTHRSELNPVWKRIAPQALGARELDVPPVVRELAGTLASRAILTFVTERRNPLESAMWKIPPLPDQPERVSLPGHPQCACQGELPPALAS